MAVSNSFATAVANDCGGLTGTSESGKRVGIDPITIATLITTILPMITQWFQACREKRQQRQQEQQDTPQQQIAAAHASPAARAKNVTELKKQVLKACRDGKAAEIKRAKLTGIPADIGRYAIDDESAGRVADKLHARFATMPQKDAEALCQSCGVT
jgi:hypothetical protein